MARLGSDVAVTGKAMGAEVAPGLVRGLLQGGNFH